MKPWKYQVTNTSKILPVFIFRWVSTIWNSSGGCGIRPDSILDHTGILSTVISNAPVDTSWVSIGKKINGYS